MALGTNRRLWLTLWIACLSALGSCRSPLDDAPGVHAAGGAGGEPGEPGASGTSGGGAETGCALEDQGCDDPESGPLLLFEEGEATLGARTKLMTVPVSRLGKEAPRLLRELPERFPYTSSKDWSPSGELLVFDEGWLGLPEGTWENRLLWTRYENGALTEPRLIPDLPTAGSYQVYDIDAESQTALFSNRGELYTVTFTADVAEAALVLTLDEWPQPTFCKGAESVLVSAFDKNAMLVPLGAPTAEPRALVLPGSAEPSPSGEHITVEHTDEFTGEIELFLGRCAPEPELTSVGIYGSVDVSWSADDQYVLVSGTVGGLPLVRVLELGAEPGGRVVFEGPGEATEVWWSPNGGKAAVFLFDRGEDGEWYLLDIALQSFEPLPAEVVRPNQWLGRRLVAWDADENLLVLDPDSGALPVLVAEARGRDISWIATDESDRYFVYVIHGDDEELHLADAANPENSRLLHATTGGRLELDAFLGIELGVLASYDPGGLDGELWWVPLNAGVAGEPVILPKAYYPELQPRP